MRTYVESITLRQIIEDMETTLIVWILVASVMTLVVLFKPIKLLVLYLRHNHLIEVGRESEEIWIPGDKLPSESSCYDED